jgi:hypothetical protein
LPREWYLIISRALDKALGSAKAVQRLVNQLLSFSSREFAAR